MRAQLRNGSAVACAAAVGGTAPCSGPLGPGELLARRGPPMCGGASCGACLGKADGMPLTLHKKPGALPTRHRKFPSYFVWDGKMRAGRIYKDSKKNAALPWARSITALGTAPEEVRTKGHAATLEEARLQFKASWQGFKPRRQWWHPSRKSGQNRSACASRGIRRQTSAAKMRGAERLPARLNAKPLATWARLENRETALAVENNLRLSSSCSWSVEAPQGLL
jgi:hypothetical protein